MEIAKLTIIDKCRKRAAEEELPLRQISDDVCRDELTEAAEQVSFASIESSMYKRRRTAMPSLPTDPMRCSSAVAGSRYCMLGDSLFFRGQVTGGENATALVFASDAQLELLQQSNLMYIDSTFRVVPSLFYQLFTIFIPHADQAFPVLFALMTRKTTDLYKAVCELFHHLMPAHKTW